MGQMRAIFLVISLLSFSLAMAQTDTLYVHFRYGSRPARGYRDVEKVWFGGLKGGHVSLEVDGQVLDFLPGKNPLFPNQNKPTGDFRINEGLYWNNANDNKRSVVSIPITAEQKLQLQALFYGWDQESPYDYAIFGMRCAAASYDAMSKVGLVKPLSPSQNIMRHFYPKLLRKRIYKMARSNGWSVQYFEGRASRKWESDAGFF